MDFKKTIRRLFLGMYLNILFIFGVAFILSGCASVYTESRVRGNLPKSLLLHVDGKAALESSRMIISPGHKYAKNDFVPPQSWSENIEGFTVEWAGKALARLSPVSVKVIPEAEDIIPYFLGDYTFNIRIASAFFSPISNDEVSLRINYVLNVYDRFGKNIFYEALSAEQTMKSSSIKKEKISKVIDGREIVLVDQSFHDFVYSVVGEGVDALIQSAIDSGKINTTNLD